MRRLLVLTLALALGAAGCGGSNEPDGGARESASEQRLADLTLDRFRASFNADAGKPRLVLLLSPT